MLNAAPVGADLSAIGREAAIKPISQMYLTELGLRFTTAPPPIAAVRRSDLPAMRPSDPYQS